MYLGRGGSFDSYEGDLAHGSWAGHEFAITALERMSDPPQGNQGEDVSGGMAKDLGNIWDEAWWSKITVSAHSRCCKSGC